MQTCTSLLDLIDDIKLPNGWLPELDCIPDFIVRITDPNGKCNVTGKPMPWKGRKWVLSKWMTDGEVVQTVFMALMAAMEHEAREGFLYKGYAILDPHYDIDKLVALRAQPDALKE